MLNHADYMPSFVLFTKTDDRPQLQAQPFARHIPIWGYVL